MQHVTLIIFTWWHSISISSGSGSNIRINCTLIIFLKFISRQRCSVAGYMFVKYDSALQELCGTADWWFKIAISLFILRFVVSQPKMTAHTNWLCLCRSCRCVELSMTCRWQVDWNTKLKLLEDKLNLNFAVLIVVIDDCRGHIQWIVTAMLI